MTITLAELGITDDPGTTWHPRTGKTGARDEIGNLVDLDDSQVLDHQQKPEAADQVDAVAPFPLAAEDSALSPEGVV